jgi:hypothetical protein
MKPRREVKKTIEISLCQRVRFEGDTEPPYWQADVWPDGNDYHSVGDTPQEALMRLAEFWLSRDAAAKDSQE